MKIPEKNKMTDLKKETKKKKKESAKGRRGGNERDLIQEI